MGTIEDSPFKVVMLPWLAHGHASPFLELAKKLSKKNITIFFCSTSINLSPIRSNLAEKNYPSIHLVEFSLPSLPELPPHYHTTNGLPYHLMPLLIQTFESAGSSILSEILKKIKPHLLIYDMFMPWVKTINVLESYNIPAVHFNICGVAALMLALSDHLNITNKFPEICFQESEKKRLNNEFVRSIIFKSFDESCEIVLVKGWQGMDGKYMDFVSDLCKKNVISVGPLLIQDSINGSKDHDSDDHDIFEWLNKKEESSTVFVSFGSESFLSKDEIKEMAHGLEGSHVNFLWVIRFPKGDNINKAEDILPKGFLQRVNERGKIVFGWAPQARILKHSSIGGFMSHCGWSSIMEGLSFGVPIIAMPLQHDQPPNARMVVELGVAREVRRDENGNIKRENIAKVIREVVVDKGGENVRKKAREVEERTRIKGDDEDVDSLVEELKKMCDKYNTYK